MAPATSSTSQQQPKTSAKWPRSSPCRGQQWPEEECSRSPAPSASVKCRLYPQHRTFSVIQNNNPHHMQGRLTRNVRRTNLIPLRDPTSPHLRIAKPHSTSAPMEFDTDIYASLIPAPFV